MAVEGLVPFRLLGGLDAGELWPVCNLVLPTWALLAFAPRWAHTPTLTLVSPGTCILQTKAADARIVLCLAGREFWSVALTETNPMFVSFHVCVDTKVAHAAIYALGIASVVAFGDGDAAEVDFNSLEGVVTMFKVRTPACLLRGFFSSAIDPFGKPHNFFNNKPFDCTIDDRTRTGCSWGGYITAATM